MTTHPASHHPEIASLLSAQRERFLRFVARRVGSVELAEDVLQAAYVKAVEHASAVRDEESASAWFYGILRNAIADHFRRRGVESAALERERALSLGEDEAAAASAADHDLHAAVCGCVGALVEKLDPAQAELLRRVEVGGERVSAVAAEAGITAGNASVRLHRARAALREKLAECCGACSDVTCFDCDCEPRVAWRAEHGKTSHPSRA